MTPTQDPFDKTSLLTALASSRDEVSIFFQSLGPEELLQRPEGKWSAADHWRHLVKSVRPLARALGLPRLFLRLLFGRPTRSSRDYAEIRRTYRAALAAGGQAGRFAPALEDVPPEAAESYRRKIDHDWNAACGDLAAAMSTWEEPDLDALRLPHPILGKLTVREMILFTLYHNLHHVENVRRRLDARGES